jgi:hypothetical protein
LKWSKKAIFSWVPIGANWDPAELEFPQQLKVLSADVMGSRFGADLQTRRAPGWFLGKCGSMADHASSDSQNNERDICKGLLIQWRTLESMCRTNFNRLIGSSP